jgi:hypothetical protein
VEAARDGVGSGVVAGMDVRDGGPSRLAAVGNKTRGHRDEIAGPFWSVAEGVECTAVAPDDVFTVRIYGTRPL